MNTCHADKDVNATKAMKYTCKDGQVLSIKYNSRDCSKGSWQEIDLITTDQCVNWGETSWLHTSSGFNKLDWDEPGFESEYDAAVAGSGWNNNDVPLGCRAMQLRCTSSCATKVDAEKPLCEDECSKMGDRCIDYCPRDSSLPSLALKVLGNSEKPKGVPKPIVSTNNNNTNSTDGVSKLLTNEFVEDAKQINDNYLDIYGPVTKCKSLADKSCQERIVEGLDKNGKYIGELQVIGDLKKDDFSLNWDFPSAVFFVITIVTTIGYGTFAPETSGGKAFTVIFAFIGIAFFGMVVGMVGNTLVHLIQKTAKCCCHRKQKKYKLSGKKTLLWTILMMCIYIALIGLGAHGAAQWNIGDAMYCKNFFYFFYKCFLFKVVSVL